MVKEKKRGRGRPRLDPNGGDLIPIMIRVTLAQLRKVRKLARKYGEGQATTIRRAIEQAS